MEIQIDVYHKVIQNLLNQEINCQHRKSEQAPYRSPSFISILKNPESVIPIARRRENSYLLSATRYCMLSEYGGG